MFGNWRPTSRANATPHSLRGVAVHVPTLSALLLGFLGQGFSPCPYHASLKGPGAEPPASRTGSVLGGHVDEDATSTGSESEGHKAACSCLDACDTESGQSLPSGRFHTRRSLSAAHHIRERLDTTLVDTRPNGYLVPLPQPPPA